MTCRETYVGSAVTSFVMQETRLHERQVLGLFHQLQRESAGVDHTGVDLAALRTQVLGDLTTEIADSSHLSDARRRSIRARIDNAMGQDTDAPTLYAAQRLMERAGRARTGLSTYHHALARRSGCSAEDTSGRMANDLTAAFRDRTLHAPREFRDRLAAEYPDMPQDRMSAYAAYREEERAVRAEAERQTRPTFTDADRIPVTSSAVATVAYDQMSGRLEVEMNSSPGRYYAYRVPRAVYDEMMAGSVGSFYARVLRNNPAFQYRNAAESDADGVRVNCRTCGQWASADHACPTRGGRDEQVATERAARRAVRARRGISTAPTTEITDAVTAGQPAGQRVMGRSWRNYRSERIAARGNRLRSINLTQMSAAAREHGGIHTHISADIALTRTEDGYASVPSRWAEGDVNVVYNGRGRGYTVTPVRDGDTPLRCTCSDYRERYDCVHVRQAATDLQTRLNADSVRGEHTIAAPTLAAVTADLSADRDESVAAQAVSQSNWADATDSPVRYSEDMDAFQRDYRAAKDRIAAGQSPVEYMTENATDGLGARNGGRAFGIELEFDIAPGRDRAAVLAAIGRELHAAGLTGSPQQGHYHAGMSRGYTENHRGGWSYERDCTVAGELVSPIMYDEPETWENLKTACDIIKRNGGVATVRTGSHVHVGVGNYDHTVENHNRLMGMFHQYQDVIYRLSSSPERGTHRGPSWCAPNRHAPNGYRTVDDAQMSNHSHNYGMNLQSVSGRTSDHAEFRTWDGTIDPGTIQTQIKVSLGIAEAAFRDRDYTPGAPEPLGAHRSQRASEHGAARRNLTGEAWQADTASYREFADRIFRRPADKAQVTGIFAATRWQQNR